MDTNVFYSCQVLWSQIDANMHLRHSAYADLAAQARLVLLEKTGFDAATLTRLHLGPILFREETIYHREVRPNETVHVTCALSKCRADGSRFSFVQKIIKDDGVLAATIHVDGAWIDTVQRKLTALPIDLNEMFQTVPKTEDFILESVVHP